MYLLTIPRSIQGKFSRKIANSAISMARQGRSILIQPYVSNDFLQRDGRKDDGSSLILLVSTHLISPPQSLTTNKRSATCRDPLDRTDVDAPSFIANWKAYV
jgi:hypothetical protein